MSKNQSCSLVTQIAKNPSMQLAFTGVDPSRLSTKARGYYEAISLLIQGEAEIKEGQRKVAEAEAAIAHLEGKKSSSLAGGVNVLPTVRRHVAKPATNKPTASRPAPTNKPHNSSNKKVATPENILACIKKANGWASTYHITNTVGGGFYVITAVLKRLEKQGVIKAVMRSNNPSHKNTTCYDRSISYWQVVDAKDAAGAGNA